MKRLLTLTAITLALSSPPSTAAGGTSRLDWMLDCWESEDGSGREVWVRAADDQLIGFGVALEEGRVVFHEVLSIRLEGEGAHYTAHPLGQAATTFSAPQVNGGSVSFTNPDHDYPQRIDYRLDGDWLRASISLLDGSKPASFDKLRCR